MPFIIRKRDNVEVTPGLSLRPVLVGADTTDRRVLVDIRTINAGGRCAVSVPEAGFGWLQVTSGSGRLDKTELAVGSIAVLPADFMVMIHAVEDLEVLVSWIPNAVRFDPAVADHRVAFRIFDWTREPVLQSEYDDRKRIYVASEALFGTSAVKGEVIIYPPGATCPEHHHKGAEHYQYVLSGSGIAVLEGEEHVLNAGDLLYNFENERHWFYKSGDTDFIFVELFIPGACRTIWAPQASVCTWAPTGVDLGGREPVRQIARHVHGDGTVV